MARNKGNNGCKESPLDISVRSDAVRLYMHALTVVCLHGICILLQNLFETACDVMTGTVLWPMESVMPTTTGSRPELASDRGQFRARSVWYIQLYPLANKRN